MKTITCSKLVSGLAIVTLLVALTGCATANYEKGAGTSAGLTKAADQIALCNDKVDATLAALNDMVENPQGDLVAKYGKFNGAVNDLLSTVKNVTAQVSELGVTGGEYFKAWDKQLALIQDPDIQIRSAQRMAEVEKQFDEIQKHFSYVAGAFQPFVSYLKDIQLALSTDLTVGGIASVKNAVEQADVKAHPLKNSVSKLVTQYRELGLAMASSTPLPQDASEPPAAAAKPE